MTRPHILLITTDELRKDALGCYGNEAVATPNLDRLAAQGILFDRAYSASPWCLPSRCALLTGQLPHNTGAYSNFRKCELSAGIPNLFTELKKTGYATSVHGKCHFAPVPYGETRPDVTLPYEAFRDYYVSLGIDHLDLQDDKQVSVWFYDDYAKELDAAGYLGAYRDATWDVKGNRKVFPFPGPEEWHPDSWVGRKAVEYLSDRDDGEPLFCWVSFSGPHYPFDPPQSYLSRVDMSKDKPRTLREGEFDDPRRIHHRSYHGDGRGVADGAGIAPDRACKNYSEAYWLELRRSYYANVALIDDQIGRILETARAKFGDDVLVIFTADHGEMLGNHGIWGKGDCAYEDVLNVPLLVQYPGERDGWTTDAKVQLTDIMETCLKTAGAESPPETDGIDFRENIARGGYEFVFSEGEGFASVSDGRWKYVHVAKMGQSFAELFDLESDPSEFHNVAELPEHAAVLASLRKQLTDLFMKKLLS
ncbi:sulfatase-like hydrolase/transferase [Cohnella zeiphila]|uniref:Sulfatase-like hydrolase/transferase n=1 Tax=Cohnella zeiphila TaxID=2761120 RepID=A0A7X0SJ15_9BACL|nr:sulfatase-like hydrolase/transferase [Cohnella zeiphila]MBB6730862.1 sulfatase-like hydrolase/transferase [Cohnella zeiphila]